MSQEEELTAKQRRRQRRREQRSREKEAQQKRVRRARWGRYFFTTALLSLAVYGGLLLFLEVFQESPGSDVPVLGREHVAVGQSHPPYNSDPPTSGPHYASLIDWGVYTEPISPEQQVHQLEHGGVLVQYKCQDCPELVERLKQIVGRYGERVILAPYPSMESKLALSAWGRLDKLQELDEGRIVRFIEAYRGKTGPEATVPIRP